MDYVYHYYKNWDHGTYGQSSILSTLTGHCSCTCFTCLYKLDLLLLLIVIYLLLMDKITININTSTITPSVRLPLVPVNDNITSSSNNDNMSNIVTSTTTTSTSSILSSSSKSPSPSPNKSLSSLSSLSSTSTSSSFVKVKTSLVNSSLPWDSMILNNSHGEMMMMINSERLTPSDQPESLPDSLNSFCSYGSLRRKLIKPDISLDFLYSSSSSESESTDDDGDDDDDEDNKSLQKIKKTSIGNVDRLEECNPFSGCANDEHFYRDTSLNEETFTNDRITVLPSSIHCS